MTSLRFLLNYFYFELVIVRREAFNIVTPIIFFLIVVCLFPLALGQDLQLLQNIAPAIIWIAALLSILLALQTLFKYENEEGLLDQLILSHFSLTALVCCKLFSRWLAFCLPLILISPLLSVFLNFDWHVEKILMITLFLGTPSLMMLGAIGAALTLSVRNNGLLLPILIMPLYIPILIFATSALSLAIQHQAANGYIALLGAVTLLTITFAPLFTSISLKIGVNQ